MEYQKVMTFLDNTPNQPFKFRTKNWVEMTHVERITKNSQIKFKTLMLKSSLCDYTDAYILLTETVTTDGAGADDNT